MHGIIADTRRGPRLPGRRTRHNREQLRKGVDGQGRFIGAFDLERGWQFFWNQPHRRAQAPLVRGDAEPRARVCIFTPDQLREMHRRHHVLKQSAWAVSREMKLGCSAVTYHLKPSASMREALASAP